MLLSGLSCALSNRHLLFKMFSTCLNSRLFTMYTTIQSIHFWMSAFYMHVLTTISHRKKVTPPKRIRHSIRLASNLSDPLYVKWQFVDNCHVDSKWSTKCKNKKKKNVMFSSQWQTFAKKFRIFAANRLFFSVCSCVRLYAHRTC